MALEGARGLMGELAAQRAPADPRATPTEMITRGLGGMLGVDARTQPEVLNEKISSVDPKDPEALKKQLAAMMQSEAVPPAKKMQAAQALRKLQQQQQAMQLKKQQRVQQAKGLGRVAQSIEDMGHPGIATAVKSGAMAPGTGLKEARLRNERGDKGRVSPTLVSSLSSMADRGNRDAKVHLEQLLADPSSSNTRAAISFLEDSGETYLDQYNLESQEGLETAITASLGQGEPEIARGLMEQVKRLKAQERNVSPDEVTKAARVVNPDFEQEASFTSNAQQIIELAEADNIAGKPAIMERLVTSMFPNDIRAQAEMDRFRQAKSVPRRLQDTLEMWAKGTFSYKTQEEYVELAKMMQDYYKERIKGTSSKIRKLGGSRNEALADGLEAMYDIGDTAGAGSGDEASDDIIDVEIISTEDL